MQHNLLLCLIIIRGPSTRAVYLPYCLFQLLHRTLCMFEMKFGIVIEDSLGYLHSNFSVCCLSTLAPPIGKIWTYICNKKSAMQHHQSMSPLSSTLFHVFFGQSSQNMTHSLVRPTRTKPGSQSFKMWNSLSIHCQK